MKTTYHPTPVPRQGVVSTKYPSFAQSLAQYVRQNSAVRRITVDELMRLSGIPQIEVTRIWHGLADNVTVPDLARIASAFEMDADELFAIAWEGCLEQSKHSVTAGPKVPATEAPKVPDVATIRRTLAFVSRSGVTATDLQPEEVHAALLAGA